MNYTRLYKVLLSALLLCSLSLSTIYIDGAQNSESTTDQKLEDVKNQIEDAENKLDEYNNQKDSLESDLADLNTNLQSLANDMNSLETQITSKQEEIQNLSAELDTATALAQKQQEDMMTRIQFMYENGTTSLLTTLLESNSFAEFLKKAEYISYITSYDNAKLKEYQQTQESIAQAKTALETEEGTLHSLKSEMKEKQDSVNNLIKDTQSQIASTDKNLEDLKKKLEEMEAYEKQLEEQKAKEDYEKWLAIQNSNTEDFTTIDYTLQEGEAYLLAAIIQCESESEPYVGKIAVGNVVMNRVKSSHFPNTITGVIYQKKQFSPVASGRLAYRLEAGVNNECIRAANEVLAGKHVIDALFFRTNNGTINGTIIGSHVFY